MVFLVIFLDAAPTQDFLNDFDTFEKLEAWLQQRAQSSTPQPLTSKVSRAHLVWPWFARLASGRRARISSLFAVIVLESARRSRLAGHYRCASVPRDAPRVLSHEPACVQRGPRRPKLQGGLPRTLCNVQAVVNSRTRSNRTRNLRHPVAWQETTLGSLVSSPSAGVQQDCEQ